MSNAPEDAAIISMHDFLDFLKIACQVQDSIEGKNLKNNNSLDYNNLAKNEMINNMLVRAKKTKLGDDCHENSNSVNSDEKTAEISPSKKQIKEKNMQRKRSATNSKHSKIKLENPNLKLDPALNEKLDEIINEGILDSVLPFVCPPMNPSTSSHSINHGSKAKSHQNDLGKQKKDSTSHTQNLLNISASRQVRRKSSVGVLSPLTDSQEVIIHVCDEIKGVSKDFKCPQKLLVSKMGYFADVTNGQKLEDMDISVHCDLQIFEWLMKWVKREKIPKEEWLSLEPGNVVPILVSASFLQMEPLLLDCLSYCHSRLSDVVKASVNLSCLNDGIITRLSAMFTNLELESVKDKKDRILPRLWTKMIQSLCELEAQALRGHYATLCSLFNCTKCGKLLTQTVSSYVHCMPQNMRINRWGQLVSAHVRDVNWNLTAYVAALHKEMKSWRKVYWRLWGHCHFMYCSTCEVHFPAYQMKWCQYHPEQPQYLGPATEGRVSGPGGRYPCCGQQAFRYETLPGPTGCQYREHTVQVDNDRDRAILQLAIMAAEGGCLYEQPPDKVDKAATNEPWWMGISLLPHRSRQGLLPNFHIDGESLGNRNRKYNISRQSSQQHTTMDSSSETDTSDYAAGARGGCATDSATSSSDSSSDGEESTYNNSPKFHRKRTVNLNRRLNQICHGRYWAGDISARSNQDNQREFEEKAMKQVISVIRKKSISEHNIMDQQQQQNLYEQGGSFIKLEAEWRETIAKQKNLARLKMLSQNVGNK